MNGSASMASQATAAWTPIALSDAEFRSFQQLIANEIGIHLSPAKRALVSARLSRRVRQLGLPSFTAYYEYVMHAAADERARLYDAICTNETRFFREPVQFEFLERNVIPAWRMRPRNLPIRVWSAACSTGEEPFSIAMSLAAGLAATAIQAEIVATDLSTKVLARAAAAEWPIAQADQIPASYLRRYMLRGRGAKAAVMKAGGAIASMVRFARLNLNDAVYAVEGPFDAIFCRNVLIYFDAEGKRRVVDRLLRFLRPGGYLFLGAAESAVGWHSDLVAARPSIARYEPRS